MGGSSPRYVVRGGAPWPVVLVDEGSEERWMLELELQLRY
jgi:hypothetical protein